MSISIISHIHLDEAGVAWIDDANVKVIEVAVEQTAFGWSAEEIHFQHPELSLAQIHAALGHYYDLQAQFDAEIERQLSRADALAVGAKDTPFRRRMRAAGKLA